VGRDGRRAIGLTPHETSDANLGGPAAAAARDRQIRTAGSAALGLRCKRALSASLRRTTVVLLAVTVSAVLAACANSNGDLRFAGNPLWQPPAHISDHRPN
jgi:hypothetical protein